MNKDNNPEEDRGWIPDPTITGLLIGGIIALIVCANGCNPFI